MTKLRASTTSETIQYRYVYYSRINIAVLTHFLHRYLLKRPVNAEFQEWLITDILNLKRDCVLNSNWSKYIGADYFFKGETNTLSLGLLGKRKLFQLKSPI
jgi:hypothetical protein